MSLLLNGVIMPFFGIRTWKRQGELSAKVPWGQQMELCKLRCQERIILSWGGCDPDSWAFLSILFTLWPTLLGFLPLSPVVFKTPESVSQGLLCPEWAHRKSMLISTAQKVLIRLSLWTVMNWHELNNQSAGFALTMSRGSSRKVWITTLVLYL